MSNLMDEWPHPPHVKDDLQSVDCLGHEWDGSKSDYNVLWEMKFLILIVLTTTTIMSFHLFVSLLFILSLRLRRRAAHVYYNIVKFLAFFSYFQLLFSFHTQTPTPPSPPYKHMHFSSKQSQCSNKSRPEVHVARNSQSNLHRHTQLKP